MASSGFSNSDEDIVECLLKKLPEVNQKFVALNDNISEIRKRMDRFQAQFTEEINAEMLEIKAEVRKEMEVNKKEFTKRNLVLKAAIKKDLATEMKSQELKMAELNGRVSGVSETISTLVQSILEVKGKEVTAATDPDEKTIQSKIIAEQLKTNEQEVRVIKGQLMGDGQRKNKESKEMSFHVEPSPFDQLTIPMNCFTLVTHNYLFQPSFRWTIDDIQSITARKRFELSSEWFQWNGYPVQARAQLELLEDGDVFISLRLKDMLKDEESRPKDFLPIPQVFYLLKDQNARGRRHLCRSQCYLFDWTFSSSLQFGQSLADKACLNHSTYNVDDSIEIEIYLEPSAKVQHAQSFDGTQNWVIQNYRRRLQLEKDGLVPCQESLYFYTGPRGYRVHLGMFLNGVKGNGPTVHVLFLTGKFDAELPESFTHSTTFTLVNRKNPEKSISIRIGGEIKNRKDFMFEVCKAEEIKNVLENDTLFCEVVIKAQ